MTQGLLKANLDQKNIDIKEGNPFNLLYKLDKTFVTYNSNIALDIHPLHTLNNVN